MSIWDEVVGQDHAVAVLREAAVQARCIVDGQSGVLASASGESSDVVGNRSMTHSWLITGPPGSGRSNVARAFAAALQCTGDEVGCGTCPGCVSTMARTHGDVTDLETDKVIITIDEVRSLVQAAQTAPTQGRWRVVLIEDADRMVERTSNVLLKAIEEPPQRTVWLLCAPSPHDMITTIRSRCRHLRLQIPPVASVAGLLTRRYGLEREHAQELARISQSHIGVAARLAAHPDQRESYRVLMRQVVDARSVSAAMLVAQRIVDFSKAEGAGTAGNEDGSVDPVEAAVATYVKKMGYESEREVPRVLQAQVRQERADAKRRFERSDRDVLDLFLVNLLSLYRDVLLVQLGAKVDGINADMSEDVEHVAAQQSPGRTVECLESIASARERINSNVTALLALEAMMMRIIP